ncbi:DUF6049 family protein [Leifsonia sp. PS1209]|uniref:DUF6049 family protein n=1 Tax=Leifsonia sp. PS1209 TaxID=2724914 RepID=UPI001442E0D8|nr:DUF6049 family protein [Leifsonia sp. PS1209]QJA00483.1 hypothetical protein HF024_19565 [Leifsonia sp. PS1209]
MSAPRFTLRQGVRSLAALVCAALAVAVVPAAASGATASGAGSAASVSAASTVSASTLTAVTTDDISASLSADNGGVLTPTQDLTVSVTVTNPTDSAYPAGSVSLWLDPSPQKSRASLNSWLASTTAVSNRVTIGEGTVTVLEPGTSTVVRITVPAAAVPFGTNPSGAVYGIGATASVGGKTVDARGSVVWNPGVASTRSSVGVVMPIVSPSTSDGLISAADLATYTSPNGVLTRDLDGLIGHSTVTVGIDPMIVASVRALGNAAPASATDWLNRLAGLPNDTFSLGFGDADVTGQVQAGIAAPLAPTSLAYALDPKNFTPSPTPVGEPSTATPTPPAETPSPTPTSGTDVTLPTLDELVAWKYSLTGIGWPGDNTVRTADLAPLAAAGLRTVIASGSNTNQSTLESTPNATLPFDGGKLVISDEALSTAIRQAASAPSDVAWNTAMSKVNAQLELISAEGTQSKQLLISFDRSWPSSGTQLRRTLETLFSSPWTTPATFPSTASAAASSGLALSDAPESQTRIDAFKALVQDEHSLDAFATVLDKPETMTGRTRAELLTLFAVSWQNPRTDWSAAVAASRKGTVDTLHSIKILPTENVNLVSAQGSIPFTVSNELKDEAANLVLTAAPSNSRLEIDQNATKRIPQDSRATMLVPVKAKLGNGQVVLSLRLYSPAGVPIGDPSAVTVDVHADWEGIGALIFGILLVLLFGFGIVRNILRRRDQRRKRLAGESGGGEGEAEVADPADAAEPTDATEPTHAADTTDEAEPTTPPEGDARG